MLSIPPRGPFYALLLILGFFQFIVALNISYGPAYSPYQPLFTTAWAIIGLFTFLSVSFLLAYGSSEVGNRNILTRCYTHLSSFCLVSFIWLCMGIFLTINAKNECDHNTNICQPLRYCSILAFIMFLLASCSAAIVTYSVTIAELRYDKHVEYAREQALERAIEQLEARSRQRSGTNRDRNGEYIPLPDLSTTTRPPPVYATAGRARDTLPV